MQNDAFQISHFNQGLLYHILPGIPGDSNERGTQVKLEGPLCKIACMSFLAVQKGGNLPDSPHMKDYVSKIKSLGQIKSDYDGFASMIKMNIQVNHLIGGKETELMVCKGLLNHGKVNKTVNSDTLKVTEDLVSEFGKSKVQSIKDFAEKYWISQKIKHEMDFLKLVDVNISQKYEKFKKVHGWESDLSKETLHNQLVFANSLSIKFFKNFYGLKHSKWNPKQPISELITLLNEHGPQIVGGVLGRAQYDQNKIVELRKYPDCILYGFKPGSYSKKAEDDGHCITIVGAEVVKGQELVYYVDPVDESLVNDKRKVLVMSYSRLCENILDTKGFEYSDSKKAKFTLHL